MEDLERYNPKIYDNIFNDLLYNIEILSNYKVIEIDTILNEKSKRKRLKSVLNKEELYNYYQIFNDIVNNKYGYDKE